MTSAFAGLCERAAGIGLRVDLEFLPWTIVPDLKIALQIVRDADQANGGVMLDCWHFYRGGGDVNEIGRLTAREIAEITSIQVSDAPAIRASPSRRDTLAVANALLLNVRDGVRVLGPWSFIRAAGTAANPHPNAYALMTEAIGARLLPGHGEIPLGQLLGRLDAAGCTPTVGLEIFSVAQNRRRPADVAEEAMRSFRHLSENAPHFTQTAR